MAVQRSLLLGNECYSFMPVGDIRHYPGGPNNKLSPYFTGFPLQIHRPCAIFHGDYRQGQTKTTRDFRLKFSGVDSPDCFKKPARGVRRRAGKSSYKYCVNMFYWLSALKLKIAKLGSSFVERPSQQIT